MDREVFEEKSRNLVSSSSTTTGFCYSDVSNHNNNPTVQTHIGGGNHQIQGGFESNQEIFNLTTGMEMIGFSRNVQQQQQSESNSTSALWKGFFTKPTTTGGGGGGTSAGGGGAEGVIGGSSKTMNDHQQSNSDFYQHQFNKQDFIASNHENLMVEATDEDSSSPWQENNRLLVDDDPSLRCVFPCEGNERPSQGLSLSLSSNNIGLQSFELRHTPTNHGGGGGGSSGGGDNSQEEMRFLDSRDGYFGKSTIGIHQQQMIHDGFLGNKASNFHHHNHQGQFHLRNSKYLGPAQELLNEFCSLGTKQNDQLQKQKSQKNKHWEDHENGTNSSRKQSLCSLEFLDLQKRKTKLLQMLEEVERRYKHYCDQMKAVVSSFEAVAGVGAATVYSALASKAMSRHFRCLRDGIVNQIQATKKAMGEKDPAAPGTSKGETPRLRVLDQTLRQQRAIQQMTMMETHPWRPQRGLPERSVSVLRAWLFEHFLHPYPSDVDKHILARQTGLSRSQVSNWFINARVRLWKPMIEEMYLEESKDHQDNLMAAAAASSDGITDLEETINVGGRSNQNLSSTDQKPRPDQLIRIDSECLSSIISNPDKNVTPETPKSFQTHHLNSTQQHHNFGAFGAVELDFSSYNHHHHNQTEPGAAEGGGVSYGNDTTSANQNFNNGGGGGVSLTLGLQQHGGNGVSLAFSPASQSSLFYPRNHIDDCQQVQYSLLDGEGQNLPYRNLMGAQLLHDLAG